MEIDEFRIVARQSGLPFTDQDVTVLFEGYGKLQHMIDATRTPANPGSAPAVVFRPIVEA